MSFVTLGLPHPRTLTSVALSGALHIGLISLLLLEPSVRRSMQEIIEVSYVQAKSQVHRDARPEVVQPKTVVAAKDLAEVQEVPQTLPASASSTAMESAAIGTQVDAYKSYLRHFLQARQKYPEMAQRLRQEGSVKVRFELARNGRVLNASLIEKSPYEILNRAAKSLIEEVHEFKPFPETIQAVSQVFTVSIDYGM